jgi:hypothetical protein
MGRRLKTNDKENEIVIPKIKEARQRVIQERVEYYS